ncbi:carbohydrate sulfotransferase 9-like [Saccoglossus kowalevskii]|uniref:Carbohydrate sulfotransferase n=1 Tax=Saccoglossus kowalevskii TaxID=10224 RepID=A0ABM0M0U0_SACKO|nr:PREDICTED: carbohydrate sulfotransferase 9-like [Saccoglossus kowalevskii]
MEWAYLLNYSPGKRKKIVLFACMVVIVYQGVHTLPKMNRVLHGLSTILTNKSTTRVATVPVIDPVESTYDSRRASEKRLEKSALECVKHKIVYNRTISTVLVSNEYRVIINVIPKVGSGTWKRLMRGIDPTSANAKGRRRLNFLKSSEYDQYVSGVFFREPLERLVSFYHFIISPHSTTHFNHYHKYIRTENGNGTTDNEPTFSQLVQMIIDHGQVPPHSRHWERQYLLSRICEFNYTFVGHMNHLSQDAPYFVHIAFGDAAHYPVVHEKKGEDKFRKTMSTLSQTLIDRLIDYYRLDYEILGFEIPDLSKK